MHSRIVTCLSCLCLFCVLIPAGFTDDPSREQYELMRLFVESFQQIETNYVTEVDRRELIEAAIRGMVRHLDPYSAYLPPETERRFTQSVDQRFGGIGVHVDTRDGVLRVMSPLPGSPAARAGIRSGDVILAVNGTSLENVDPQEAVSMIQGPAGRPVRLLILHAGEGEKPVELTVEREVIQIPTVYGIRLRDDDTWDFMYAPDEKIGYIHLSHFSRMSADEVRSAVSGLVDDGLRGLILDLRSNPGGLLDVAIEICDLFLSEGLIVSVRGRNVDEQKWLASAEGTFPDFPMAVLVNRYSASASEVVSAALQDHGRAVVVGERTWGKGSVQNVIRLGQGGSRLKLTMAWYHRPSGVNIHRSSEATEDDDWGVRPNPGLECRFTNEQFRDWALSVQRREVFLEDGTAGDRSAAFEDIQMNAALAWLRERLRETAAAPSDP